MARTLKHWAVCLRNDGYEASLERRNIYQVIHDEPAAKHRLVRVVDESGNQTVVFGRRGSRPFNEAEFAEFIVTLPRAAAA